MVVLIFHPTEELKITRLQKQLIFNLNDKNSIWFRKIPLWVEFPEISITTKQELKEFQKETEGVEVGEPVLSSTNDEIFLPVTLKQKSGNEICSTLPLLHLLSGKIEIQPQELLKTLSDVKSFSPNVFRLGIAQLHNSSTTVQSSQTSSYILQDSVWFKKSK